MTNKVIIGVLVFLVIVSSAACVYSYNLGQQVNVLNRQLRNFQQEQAAQIAGLGGEFISVREKTSARISILEDGITEARTMVGILEDEISGTRIKVGVLEGETRSLAAELSQSLIDVNKIYQTASQATVRISDQNRTIGSGFVFDDQAHVVTAYHVVERLSEVYVVFPDGRISAATVIGTSKESDVAVLTLDDEPDVEPLAFADSANLKIGEPVVAIGNPFDLTETLTLGIVSQVDRFVEIEMDAQARSVANLVQFDAAANFGNSGGPLLDSEGRVVGMVIGRVKPDRGDGIGYAVSSSKLKRVADSIIERGYFEYPWIGVEIANLNPQVVRTRNLKSAHGVLVKKVFAGSPAEAAGVRVEDIIVTMDGREMRDIADLTSYLGEHKTPDELAVITVIRGTRKFELSLRIGKR